MKYGGGRLPQKRKRCGAHLHTDQELLRAALRFAPVPQEKRWAPPPSAVSPYALF